MSSPGEYLLDELAQLRKENKRLDEELGITQVALKTEREFVAHLKDALSRDSKELSSVRARLEEAEGDVSFLECLRSYGVDNWSGYEMAADEWRSSHKDEDE